MKARGAVIHEIGGKWQVEDLELDGPKDDEVLIQVMASGLCSKLTKAIPRSWPPSVVGAS